MNCRRLALLILLTNANGLFADTPANRQCWQHETPAGLRQFVAVDEERWELKFPNGSSAALEFRKTTDEYVELQNVQNKNVLRLFSDRGMLQRAGSGPFRKFANGEWIEPPELSTTESDYRVRVVYFIPTDRQPTSDYAAKIHNIVTLMAEIMTAELRVKGYETDGPQFEMDGDQIAVHVLNGERESLFYNQNGAWKDGGHTKAVFDEVSRRDFDRRKFMTLIFSETYEPGPSPKLWPGHLAVAAASPPNGALGLFSAWILRDKFACADDVEFRSRFFDETPIEGRAALGSKLKNSPRADFMEDGVGGALHELTHMLGAVHHKRNGISGVMSQGFRDLRWNVGLKTNRTQRCRFSDATAAMVMTSRFLNDSVDRTDNTRPDAKIQVTIREPNAIVEIKATDDRTLTFLYLIESGPFGRQVIEGRELNGKSETVKLTVNGRDLDRDANEFVAIVVDGGGNQRRVGSKIIGR